MAKEFGKKNFEDLKNELLSEQLKAYHRDQQIQGLVVKSNSLKVENDQLKNICDSNIEKTKIWSAVKFLLKVIFKIKS